MGNWTFSQSSCVASNSHLALFHSLEELNFLKRYKGTSDHWIGLHRASTQHPWIWTDNTEYSNLVLTRGGGECGFLSDNGISSGRSYTHRKWICSKFVSSCKSRVGSVPRHVWESIRCSMTCYLQLVLCSWSTKTIIKNQNHYQNPAIITLTAKMKISLEECWAPDNLSRRQPESRQSTGALGGHTQEYCCKLSTWPRVGVWLWEAREPQPAGVGVCGQVAFRGLWASWMPEITGSPSRASQTPLDTVKELRTKWEPRGQLGQFFLIWKESSKE